MSPPPPAVSEPVAPPLHIRERERYEVLAEHGRGGLGRVSRARGNGGTWLYDVRSDTWAYGAEHAAEVFFGAFSPDGALFASGDRRGIVTVRNVASTLAAARAAP